MAIKQLPNGKYQVTVRDRLSRKEQQRTFQRKGDAEAWEREQKHAMDHGRYMRDSKETVAERCDSWIGRKKKAGGYRFGSIQDWEIQVDDYIKPQLGHLRMQRLTIKKCKDAAVEWKIQCSAHRANVVLKTLTAILRDAQEEEIVDVNVAEKTPRIKISTEDSNNGEIQPGEVYREEDMAALIEATEPGSADRIVVWLGGFCGMRIGEILGFSWPAIDLKAKKPKVRVLKNLVAEEKVKSEFPGYKNTGRALRDPKSKKSRGRAIDAPRELVQDLRLWKLKWTPAQPVAREDGEPFDPLAHQIVLTTVEGKPFQRKAVQAMLDVAIRRAEIKERRTLHRLRHTFASLLLATGEPGMLPRVSRLLGHGDVGITSRVYMHFIEDDTTPAQDLASRVLARAKKKDAVDE